MIGLIVARSKNNVIGRNGQIPWRIKGEQKQFKELTTGNVVVMGRKSYEEIGHPLPNRLNIIVSRTAKYEGKHLLTAASVQEAIAMAEDEEARRRAGFDVSGAVNIYVSGGCGLYKEAVSFVDKMYVTEVDAVVEDGDVFFPEFDPEEFELVVGETGGDKIIGTSGMSIVEKPPYYTCPTGRLGILSSMFTNPDYRRMGIAMDLLDRVVEEARSLSCGAVWITASDMGVKLYTAYGFAHNGNIMQYKL